LADAFLTALETKALSDITVSEICAESGISRKTFYKYYSDQFEFFKALQEDLFVGLSEELRMLPPNIFEITPALILFAEKHRVLIRAALENWSGGGFIDQIIKYLYTTYHQEWEEANPRMPHKDVEYLFHYVVYGLIGIIRHWLVEDSSMPMEDVILRADHLLKISTPRQQEG